MRFAFNGLFLDKPMTGSGQYARHLLRELLVATAGEVEWYVLCSSLTGAQIARQVVEEAQQARSELIHVEWLKSPLGGNLGKLWFEQVAVPRASQVHQPDLLHVPYFGPPRRAGCPLVVTVHDLIMLVLPQHRGSFWVRQYTKLAAAGTRAAQVVLADSAATKCDVERLLGIPSERIRVVLLACDTDRYKPIEAKDLLSQIRRRYRLTADARYILYLGGLDWRKNVPTLVRAFARLGGSYRLAIAGEAHSKNQTLYPNLRAVVEQTGVEDRVDFLGFVEEDDKPALYALAGVFVFPSRYEGFGLPPLEAMACGTPVICSSASSLPEVVDGAGLLFDPDDEVALAQHLQQALEDKALRETLRAKGLERAREFSWRRCAEETLAAYRSALSSN